ncbi:hypothetical protein B5M44_26325 [Shinella sumterensis]|nr:hypothetical protein B5M44_26325 [Shinella sumterensis]
MLKENIMTMKACILAASHLKTVLEIARDNSQLHSALPLLEAALIEVESVRRTQALPDRFVITKPDTARDS